MCEQARRLLQLANEAALDFSKTLSSLLLADLESPRAANYNARRQAVHAAHTRSMDANRAFDEHLREHNCDAANFDSESPKRSALYAEMA
jgi:hypothetical protein